MNLTTKQILTWQSAYNLNKEGKVLCLGSLYKTKEGKQFLKPFVDAGYIHLPALIHCGVWDITKKGIEKFKELQAEVSA